MKKFILFTFIFFISNISYSNEIIYKLNLNNKKDFQELYNEHGIILKFDKNMNLKEYREYKDNKLNGLSIQYYDNGKIKNFRNYKNGKLNGLARKYLENGTIRWEGKFKNGVPYGDSPFFHKDMSAREKLMSIQIP